MENDRRGCDVCDCVDGVRLGRALSKLGWCGVVLGCLCGDRRRDLSVCGWWSSEFVIASGRLSSDLDRGAALSGEVSLDWGMGGNACTKLGCVEWSKMGSLAFENCVAWTGSNGVSSEIAN